MSQTYTDISHNDAACLLSKNFPAVTSSRDQVCNRNIFDLYVAIMLTRNTESMRTILDNNPDLDLRTRVGGATVLSLALYANDMRHFSLILSRGGARLDVNQLSVDGERRVEPPLVTSCRLCNVTAVQHLLTSNRVDLEKCDNFRHNALWWSVRQRHLPLVKLLVSRGASVNPSPLYSSAPLHLTVTQSRRRTLIAKHLLLHGASTSATKSGQSMFLTVLQQRNTELALCLFEVGCSVRSDEEYQECRKICLSEDDEALNTLLQLVSNPCSLKQQCRRQVRRTVALACRGVHFIEALQRLPLPKLLLDYISLGVLPFKP